MTHPKQHSSKIHNRKIGRHVIRIDYNCNKVKQVKFCIPDCGISGSRNVLILIFSGHYQLIFPFILLPAAWESAAFLCGGKCWVLSKSFIFTSLRNENDVLFWFTSWITLRQKFDCALPRLLRNSPGNVFSPSFFYTYKKVMT